MAFVPDSKAAVRLYRRHQRHARFARHRYGAQEAAFLNANATQLSSTKQAIFNFLYDNTAFQIDVATNTNQLTADNVPFTGN